MGFLLCTRRYAKRLWCSNSLILTITHEIGIITTPTLRMRKLRSSICVDLEAQLSGEGSHTPTSTPPCCHGG